jgi:hypothetical protein
MTRSANHRSLSRAAVLSSALLLSALGVACKQVRSTPQRLGHEEVKPNLNGIRAAQIAHRAVHGSYVEVLEPVPRPAEALNNQQVDWPEGSAFDQLDWAPVGRVAGTYWVELGQGGDSFVVHGLIDADGDGTPAHFTATRGEGAAAITSEGVF